MLGAWTGKTDLGAPTASESVGQGPIAQALVSRAFDEAFLLCDPDDELVQPCRAWLKGRTRACVAVLPHKAREREAFAATRRRTRKTNAAPCRAAAANADLFNSSAARAFSRALETSR